MSRIGNQPVSVPEGVKVEVSSGKITASGPKGKLEQKIDFRLKVRLEGERIFISRQEETKKARSLHGLTRTLIDNMVQGVSKGWSKTLRIVGTGYRAALEGQTLVLSLGFSHPVKITPPEEISFEIVDKDGIRVSGRDKAKVGEVAAQIRKARPPEPYKGKGIRYEDEVVRRKAGKAAKTGAAGVAG